jgi:hypothetical protein
VIDERRLAQVAGKRHAAVEVELARQRFEARAVFPVAADDTSHAAGRGLRKGLQQQVSPFQRRESRRKKQLIAVGIAAIVALGRRRMQHLPIHVIPPHEPVATAPEIVNIFFT